MSHILHYYNIQEVCYQYWPPTITEGVIIGEFTLKLQIETKYKGYIERTIVISNKVCGYTFKVFIIYTYIHIYIYIYIYI